MTTSEPRERSPRQNLIDAALALALCDAWSDSDGKVRVRDEAADAWETLERAGYLESRGGASAFWITEAGTARAAAFVSHLESFPENAPVLKCLESAASIGDDVSDSETAEIAVSDSWLTEFDIEMKARASVGAPNERLAALRTPELVEEASEAFAAIERGEYTVLRFSDFLALVKQVIDERRR